MKYLSFMRSAESYRQSPPPAALMQAMGEFMEGAFKDGSLVDAGGLLPSDQGLRLRLANGEITVTDGPFSESKEIIGGWAVLQGKTKADVVRIATEFVDLHRRHWPGFECECEIRQVEEPDGT